MNQVARFDTAALNRAFIGFDALFEDLERRVNNTNYPPHNIVKHNDDKYEIQLAVTGFEKNEITVELNRNNLTIKGTKPELASEEAVYLHRGLATRDFTKVFPLAEHIEVGEVTIKNGVLSIALARVIPESLKPRLLEIKGE